MDLSPYIASLREDLATAASAGDENTRRTAAALSAALEPAARLAIMNALSDLAAEVTASLDGQVVEVRLAGRDVQVVVTGSAEPEPEPAPRHEVPLGDATGDISRITLRMINELKSKAEAAAAAQGVSLNSFIQQAVGGAVHGKHKHQHKGWSGGTGSGSRVRGWVQG
ncbi:HicB-like protein involved in pilus formation [Lentzea atacamensis]|uniref:HicB-like protein involved in pilus formation n=2 Tax=Lentzea TaxID=165301 RepID=A0A316IFB1_9PSEU|nr:toxin-antitoxin system HicB family antitoxin [Lentzea atacamensis]PWK88988.1 HicB-like protein involved in pilus formation [Lentzea atacamensis]RAS61706.1 HicB-like protein involved in pilus formation [Lentzea atacamensis]